MKTIFLGFYIKKYAEVLKDDNFPQVQTYKFAEKIAKSIALIDELEVSYISSRAVSEYPSYRLLVAPKIECVKFFNRKFHVYEMPFVNKGILKIFTRFIFSLIYCFYFFIRISIKDKKEKIFFVYSVHLPYLMTASIINACFKVKVVGVWTDPPAEVLEGDSFLKKKLRMLELKFCKFFMRKFKKIIVLTKQLAYDFSPDADFLVIEGFSDISEKKSNLARRENNKVKGLLKIVYTGTLARKYGIENLVSGFLIAKVDGAILEIYGVGDYQEELLVISRDNPSVKYMGFLDPSAIPGVQSSADFLINARSASEEFTKYSFPSKIIEYFESGVPVISTVLPGMPEEYVGCMVKMTSNDPKDISCAIRKAVNMSMDERVKMAEAAFNLATKKSIYSQSARIHKFLM